MTGASTIATGLAGTVSVAMVDGRPIMAVVHKPGSGASTGVTGTGSFPSLSVGFSALESLDDGATWSLLGTGTVGNTASSIGLGAGIATGPVVDVGGAWLCCANYYGNYFGDSTPNPGIYRSTNGGASWAAVHTPDGGPYSGNFSRNVAIDDDGVLWWGDKGGGIGLPYLHLFSSANDGASWSDLGDAGAIHINTSLSFDNIQSKAWGYSGSGALQYGTAFSALDDDVDKIAWDFGYPYPADIGQPALVAVSRDRTIAFGGHWVDLVMVGRGWQINRCRLG